MRGSIVAQVYIDDLLEGMVLDEDLFTPTGRFILAEGAAVSADLLTRLKDWGIFEVNIAEESLGDEYRQKQQELTQFVERAESSLYRRFVLNDLEQAPLACIYRQAVHRFALSLQKGWDPEKFEDSYLPAAVDSGEAPLSVAQLLAGDVELVSPPTVYSYVSRILGDPESSSHQVADVISKDASLSIKLLKLVNSPFYGFAGKVDTVNRAVSLLGTDELSALTLGVTVVDKFKNIPSELLDMDAFWRHSIRCGLFARILAGHLKLPGEESYFTGGLLHDIGRLIMLDRMPGAYAHTIIKGRDEQLPMYRAELETLHTDHGLVGKLLTMRWRLPPQLCRMIGGHHALADAQYAKEACLIHLADLLAHACGQELNLVNEIPPFQIKAWEELGMQEEFLAPTIRQVDTEFNQILKHFFE